MPHLTKISPQREAGNGVPAMPGVLGLLGVFLTGCRPSLCHAGCRVLAVLSTPNEPNLSCKMTRGVSGSDTTGPWSFQFDSCSCLVSFPLMASVFSEPLRGLVKWQCRMCCISSPLKVCSNMEILNQSLYKHRKMLLLGLQKPWNKRVCSGHCWSGNSEHLGILSNGGCCFIPSSLSSLHCLRIYFKAVTYGVI